MKANSLEDPETDCRALQGQPSRRAHRAAHPGHRLPAARRGGPERQHPASAACWTATWNTPASMCSATAARKSATSRRPTG
ncbi:MAG: hypothetical protein WKG07_25270 [Hymenobacter sp.]